MDSGWVMVLERPESVEAPVGAMLKRWVCYLVLQKSLRGWGPSHDSVVSLVENVLTMRKVSLLLTKKRCISAGKKTKASQSVLSKRGVA